MPKAKEKAPVDIVQGAIVTFSETEKQLGELRSKYAKENLPTADTAEGYEFLRLGIAEVRTLRTGTDKHRKAIIQPFVDAQREVNNLAKTVMNELIEIEAPMKELKQVEDDRKAAEKAERERIKAEKIMAVEARINTEIRSLTTQAAMGTSEEIKVILDTAKGIDPKNYEDRELSAESALSSTISDLELLYERKAEEERAEAVRLEQERIRAEQEKEQEAIRAEAEAKLKAEREAFEEERRKLEEEKAALEIAKAEITPAVELPEGDNEPEEETKPSEPIVAVETPETHDVSKLESMLKIGLTAAEIYHEIRLGSFQTITLHSIGEKNGE